MATKGKSKEWVVLQRINDPFGSTTDADKQAIYLSPKFIRGFEPMTVYVKRVDGVNKFGEQAFVFPAATNSVTAPQEHTISVDKYLGGAISNWTIRNPQSGQQINNGENIINRADTSGRMLNMALTFTTPSDFYGVSSVSKAAAAVVTLTEAHGIPSGKQQKIVLAGCNGTANIAVDGTRVATSTGTTTMTIPVDTSLATGAYAAGTAEFVMDHNPTQDGSGVPATNTAADIQRSFATLATASMSMTSLVSEVIPLEWGPDGTNAERNVYHGGDTDRPVVWPGIKLRSELEPNCSVTVGSVTDRVNGLHRIRTEVLLDHDIELGTTTASGVTPSLSIGHPIYMRPSYGRGISAANTRAFIYKTDDLTALYMDAVTAPAYTWSAGGGHGDERGAGYFFDPDDGTLVRVGGSGDATTNIGARSRAFIAYEISGADFYVGLRIRENATMLQWPEGDTTIQYAKHGSSDAAFLNNQGKDDDPAMILQQYLTFASGAGKVVKAGRYWYEWYLMTATSSAELITQALILDAAGV